MHRIPEPAHCCDTVPGDDERPEACSSGSRIPAFRNRGRPVPASGPSHKESLVLFITVICFTVASYAQSDLHEGESLLQPMPIPGDGWEVSSRNDGASRSVRWSHPTSGESLTTTISNGGRQSTDRFRQINDRTGRSLCDKFSTRTIQEGQVNGCEREIWLAECEQGNSNSFSILHQVIAGRDSTYYVVKRWPDYPGESELDSWIEYFLTFSVCDTRGKRQAPCPKIPEDNGR